MLFSSEQIIHIFDTEEAPREGSQSQPPPGGVIVQGDRHCPRGDHPVLKEGRSCDMNLAMLLTKSTQADSGQKLRPGFSRD